MKRRTLWIGSLLGLVVFGLIAAHTPAWAGTMKITMADGTSLEVPYFWEENGEIKFEIAGGVAGIPKSQVASVQEILTAKEFDPEVLLETPHDAGIVDQDRSFQELLASKLPQASGYEKLSPEESDRVLKMAATKGARGGEPVEKVYAPNFTIEGNFAELVRDSSNGPLLVLRNVVSSRGDLRNQGFTMILYDQEGSVLLRKPCEVKEMEIDQKVLRQNGIAGRLYTVVAAVKPDQNIKRYEITASQR